MQGFEAFYKDKLPLAYAMALSRVREPAQAKDLAQEAFLRAWRHYARLTCLAAPAQRAWLLTTIRNLCVDSWRRNLLEKAVPMEEAQPVAPRVELQWDLLQALSELEDGDREIVILRYLQGLNSREIGESLGMPEGTVRRKLSECGRRLAGRLKAWAPEGVKA